MFYGRVPNSLISTPKRYQFNNSKIYITGTANFNSDKDNFRTLSSQGLFESIVINLTETTLAAFSTLSGPNQQIKTPKRYDEHPCHLYRRVPSPTLAPPPPGGD